MVLATWVAIAVLAGAMVAILRLTNVPGEQLYDSVVDGDAVAAAVVVFGGWSVVTFMCGASLTWAVLALRARVVALRLRRAAGEPNDR
jgi:hypothetical protein